MSKMFSNELIKLFSGYRVLVVILLLVLTNFVVVYFGTISRMLPVTPESYKEMHERVSILPQDDALLYLEWRVSDVGATRNFDFGDFAVSTLVRDEFDAVINYQRFLDRIDEAAKTMTTFGIFAAPGTFSYRNAIKTAEDFAHMREVEPQFYPSLGIAVAVESDQTDIIAVAMILAVSMLLFMYEKESNLLLLSRTTVRGGAHHAIAKLFAVFFVCLLLIIILYKPKLMMGELLFGLGDLSRPLQSVSGYNGGTLAISIFEFLFLYWGLKLFALMAIGAVFSFIATTAKSAIQSYLITVVLVIVFYLMSMVPHWSPFSILAVISPVSWLRAQSLLSQYLNINLFENPTSRLGAVLVVIGVSLIIFSAAAVIKYSRQNAVVGKNFKFSIFRYRKNAKTHKASIKSGLMGHELYKLMIQNKVLLILSCLIIAVSYISVELPVREHFADIDEMHFKRISIEHEGVLNQSRREAIIAELRDLETPTMRLNRLVQERFDYLNTVNNGVFLYDEGYRIITFEDISNELWIMGAASLVLIVVLGSIFTMERQSGMIVLLKSSVRGGADLFWAKVRISIVVTIFIGLLIYVTYILSVLNAYGFHALSAPAYSMQHLWFLPEFISIGSAVILSLVLRVIVLLLIMAVVLWCSYKSKKMSHFYAMSLGMIVAPLVILMLLV